MNDHAMRAPAPHYDTTLDRAGFALALGGALGGIVVCGAVYALIGLVVMSTGSDNSTSRAMTTVLRTVSTRSTTSSK